jgi:hypothetical protein
MKNLVKDAYGPANRMLGFGTLGIALSLWEKRRRDENNFANAKDGPRTVCGITIDCAVSIHERVNVLEAHLSLAPATDGEMDEQLDTEQLTWILQALTDGWLTNLIWIPNSWSQSKEGAPTARTGAHFDKISINPSEAPLFEARVRREEGIWVVALELSFDMMAYNVVLVGGHNIRTMRARMGCNSILPAILSRYAHCGESL